MSTGVPTLLPGERPDAGLWGDPLGIAWAERASHPAVAAGSTTLTHGELNTAVEDRARRFGSGRSCEVLAPANTLESLVDYLGALRAGRVPLLTTDPRAHRDYQGASLLHPDLALLLATSGSTGSPRVVRLSHDNVVANARAIAETLGLDDSSRAITSLPMHYCYGLSAIHSHLLAGGSVVMSSESVTEDSFWETMSDAAVTTLSGVPHTFALLDAVGFADMDLPNLRVVTQAGGRLDPESIRRYRSLGRRRGWDFFVMYGQTEATARMACLSPTEAEAHPHSVGRAVPGGSFRIESPADGVGEIVYRGPNVMMGYADTAADLAAGPHVAELHTGDLGSLEDGFLVVTGRARRIAKPFGYRVDLDHLERRLAEAGVAAAATEVPAAPGGTRVRVMAEAPSGPDGAQLRQLLGEQVSLSPAALDVIVVDRLPRLASGKVDYPAVADPDTAPASGETAGDTEAGVAAALAHAVGLEPDQISPDDTFVSLGGDSLGFIQCSIALERTLGHLPESWHEMSVVALEAHRRAPRRWSATIDVGAALRAVAILAIVARHVRLLDTGWGAHALLALCGLNVARFQLTDPSAAPRRLLNAAFRLAVPAVAWLGLVVLFDRSYRLANVFLINDLTGDPTWGPPWRYWFIETLVQILLITAVVYSIPRLRALDRRAPFLTAVAATLGALVLRADVLDLVPAERHLNHPLTTVWLFTLGWAMWRADTPRRRAAATALIIVACAGYFGEWRRDAIVVAALLLAVWVRQVRVPRSLAAPIGTIASASLFIYLTHWQVYPSLREPLGALGAGTVSVIAGIAAWAAWDRFVQPHLPDWSRP